MTSPAKLRAALDTIRARITDLKAARLDIEAARVTLDEAEARIAAAVDGARRHFAPNLAAFFLPSYAPSLADLGWTAQTFADRRAELLLWLHGDALKSRLIEEARALAPDREGISSEERRARLAELDAELLQREREEEKLVVEAEAAGLAVLRRADADPRAVLEVVE